MSRLLVLNVEGLQKLLKITLQMNVCSYPYLSPKSLYFANFCKYQEILVSVMGAVTLWTLGAGYVS